MTRGGSSPAVNQKGVSNRHLVLAPEEYGATLAGFGAANTGAGGRRAHDGASRRQAVPAASGPSLFPAVGRSNHMWSSRAVSRNRNCGTSAVLGIRLDGLDNQVEFVGAVDLPRDAVILTRCGCVGFGEVMQPIDAACRVIPHEQDGTGAVFHPRKLKRSDFSGSPARLP